MSATLSRSLTLAAACWGDLSEQAAFDRTIEVRCANASSDEKAARCYALLKDFSARAGRRSLREVLEDVLDDTFLPVA